MVARARLKAQASAVRDGSCRPPARAAEQGRSLRYWALPPRTIAISSYCDIAPGHPVHGPYHASEYGVPKRDEAALFERLVLEINQAGLSWETILRKRDGFLRAYDGFDVDTVAAYGERDRLRLLDDPAIIRNRLKVDAAIHNAGVIAGMRASHGGFAAWLDAHLHEGRRARDKASWVNLFKRTFKFTGGEITGEFLMSLGILPGAHRAGCAVGDALSPWRAEPGLSGD